MFVLTGGNAFLLTEVWRALVETGAAAPGADLAGSLAALDTPDGVRDVVSQRLARLEAATQAVLELASVAGPEFETDVIRQAGRLDAAALAAALDDGVASGMIEEVPGHTLAHRFTHELVRRALYDRLAAGRRAELHLRIAEALDERASDGSARALGDVAHHFAAAAPIGGADRAVEYSLLAAAAAMVALAFDEAAVALRTALELGIPGGTDRADALLDLGAVTYRAGRSVESQDAYLTAADIARSLGDGKPPLTRRGRLRGRLLADGDRRPGRAPASRGGGGGARSGRLRAACARARTLSAGRWPSPAGPTRARWCATRRSPWPAGSATGRGSRSCSAAPTGCAVRRRSATSSTCWRRGATSPSSWATSRSAPRRSSGVSRRSSRSATSAPRGSSSRRCSTWPGRMRQPFALHVAEQYAAAIALCDGRLREAEAAAERSREWSRLLAGRDPSSVYGIQMFGIRREQGRLAELAPAVRALAVSDSSAAWRPGLAALMAELGMIQ